MPKRTAKFNHPDNDNMELESIKAEQENQDDLPKEEEIDVLSLNNLRELIFLGEMRDSIEIAGFKFEITTLTTRQQRDVMRTVMKFDQVDRILDMKPVTVSYVVKTINGVPIEDLCEDDTIEEIEDRRLAVVMNMQSTVIERLYQAYDKLVVASHDEIGLEYLKE